MLTIADAALRDRGVGRLGSERGWSYDEGVLEMSGKVQQPHKTTRRRSIVLSSGPGDAFESTLQSLARQDNLSSLRGLPRL